MRETTVLYLHGLGREELRPKERRILAHNQQTGIEYAPAFIDWRSSETFEQLLARITAQASDLLGSMDNRARLVIEGSSAGGSLAINTAKQLKDSRVRSVSHSGRLTVGNFSDRDWRNLSHCAHLGTERASQSFYYSVVYCDTVTRPSLTQAEKSHILITKPWADEVVPVSTMTIAGIRTATMPMIGHSFGIGVGMLRMPALIEELA